MANRLLPRNVISGDCRIAAATVSVVDSDAFAKNQKRQKVRNDNDPHHIVSHVRHALCV